MSKELWVRKYRPETLAGYVFRDQDQKRQVTKWINEGYIPHLLLSGHTGTGKTTLAYVLLNELGVNSSDILKINASEENSVDTVRDKIIGFASTMSWGEDGMRYIILDEADYMTQNAQGILRGVMEEYDNNCRFIITCNYPNRIIQPIHGRCQGFHIKDLDQGEFLTRIIEILSMENFELDESDIDALETYISLTYPDMRRCINMLQQNCSDGKIRKPKSVDTDASMDYLVKAIESFSSGNFKEARQALCKGVRPGEYESTFRFLYNNLKFWGEGSDKQDSALLAIRKGLVWHATCADPEINLAATLVELDRIRKE